MSRSAWRIGTDTKTYQADDLSGTGARKSGGRWNAIDVPMVYCASSRALACLETFVHLKPGSLPLNRYLVEVVIPDDIWAAADIATATSLKVGWDALPEGQVSVEFGSAWIAGLSSLILKVPSIIVPEEFNVLINPNHGDLTKLKAEKVRKWTYDPRLRGAK